MIVDEVAAIARLPRAMARRFEAKLRDAAAATGRRCIDWILREIGRSAVLYRIVDEVVEYLVRNPEVEELVRKQSATLVGQAVDELRTGAARADGAVDRIVLALRRRVRRR